MNKKICIYEAPEYSVKDLHTVYDDLEVTYCKTPDFVSKYLLGNADRHTLLLF